MYSTKETKSAAKTQKKAQKVNKKQQIKQQQPSLPNGNKVKSPANAKNTQPNNNNNHTNINNNNNNNSIIVPNNNSKSSTLPTNTAQKFREHYDAEKRNQGLKMGATTLPGYENVPKMERSNSFSLRNKLSKLINHLTGSKENLSRTDDDEDSSRTPYIFTRSRSMIQMRRPNRRSFIEPQLEQLSEETEKSGDLTSPASPRKTSVADFQVSSPVLLRRSELTGSVRTPARRQSAQPFTSTPLEEVQSQVQRKGSLMSLNQTEPTTNPQLNFQKRRSNTLIASFKSTFSGLTSGGGGAEKKEKMNPKWSASLQSLQAIDNMVSYANMSFIDYDKFNGYEKQLERQQSLMSLAEQPVPTATQLPLPPSALAHSHSPSPLGEPPRTPVHLNSSLDESVRTVVMRRKRSKASLEGRSKTSLEGRSSMASLNSAYNLDTDYEHNLDRVHNVYRESLDSRTLELLNPAITELIHPGPGGPVRCPESGGWIGGATVRLVFETRWPEWKHAAAGAGCRGRARESNKTGNDSNPDDILHRCLSCRRIKFAYCRQ
ncbi:serine/threonine-protein kinase pakA-like [Drosophila gunungcola]|uniref:serine/threonine-protein kinase pakA-like n=1 Tax=Drosophila gunungcola TaxID=103775 RepID=UPI0022E72499|nr:serine/threonine-protein kinase pakA-like [Drosophila gunungcola]